MMFPILTFVLLLISSVAWMIFAGVFWDDKPARVAGVLFATTLALLSFSLNTPDIQAWNCSAPPETMTASQHTLNRVKRAEKEAEVRDKGKDCSTSGRTQGDRDRLTIDLLQLIEDAKEAAEKAAKEG